VIAFRLLIGIANRTGGVIVSARYISQTGCSWGTTRSSKSNFSEDFLKNINAMGNLLYHVLGGLVEGANNDADDKRLLCSRALSIHISAI
jgi:hypothetical protein